MTVKWELTRVKIQGVRKLMVMAMVVVVVVVVMMGHRLFLDPPAEMMKVIDGTRELEGALGAVTINLVRFVQEALEKRMIKIRNWDHESLSATPTFFF